MYHLTQKAGKVRLQLVKQTGDLLMTSKFTCQDINSPYFILTFCVLHYGEASCTCILKHRRSLLDL